MIVARRQVYDPVQGHAAPRLGRDREGREKPIGRVSNDFIPNAGVAASDVCLHILGQPRPDEVLRHQRLRPGHTIVPSQGRVLVLLQ